MLITRATLNDDLGLGRLFRYSSSGSDALRESWRAAEDKPHCFTHHQRYCIECRASRTSKPFAVAIADYLKDFWAKAFEMEGSAQAFIEPFQD